jgi:hypothetical protein
MREKPMAVVRICLGLAQIITATVSLYFLLATGMSHLTLVAAGLTAVLLLLSKILAG